MGLENKERMIGEEGWVPTAAEAHDMGEKDIDGEPSDEPVEMTHGSEAKESASHTNKRKQIRRS